MTCKTTNILRITFYSRAFGRGPYDCKSFFPGCDNLVPIIFVTFSQLRVTKVKWNIILKQICNLTLDVYCGRGLPRRASLCFVLCVLEKTNSVLHASDEVKQLLWDWRILHTPGCLNTMVSFFFFGAVQCTREEDITERISSDQGPQNLLCTAVGGDWFWLKFDA